jgi:hypothetical protein
VSRPDTTRAANYLVFITHQSASGSALTSLRLDFYEAAAPTAAFRAGGVQRKAAPNLFQTLIDATVDVR